VSEPLQKPVCPECGSANVSSDATVRWNIKTQQFEVTAVHGNGSYCDDCETIDIEFEWKDLPGKRTKSKKVVRL
jgi:hypothetical protein